MKPIGAARLLLTPAVVALVLIALWAWVGTQDVDSIAQRSLSSVALREAIVEHARLVLVGTLLTLAIGVPLGVLLTRPGGRLLAPVALGLANLGQATPAIGVLALLVIVFGIGFDIAIVSLVAYALLPVLRNTIAGLRGVDTALVDAARGQGMSRRQLLVHVELPLAVPVILAGVRTALVLIVGVATLATFVNAGGLGDLIVAGIKTQRTAVLVTGAVLTACFAVLVDWVGGLVEHAVTPRGITPDGAI